MQDEPTVFVVDDDAAMRKSMVWLIQSVGLRVEAYASARAFLAALTPERRGCAVVDLRMPGGSGLDVQDELIARQSCLPIILISAHAEIPAAVRATASSSSIPPPAQSCGRSARRRGSISPSTTRSRTCNLKSVTLATVSPARWMRNAIGMKSWRKSFRRLAARPPRIPTNRRLTPSREIDQQRVRGCIGMRATEAARSGCRSPSCGETA